MVPSTSKIFPVGIDSSSVSQIELELTERTVVADIEQTLDTMRQLKEVGFIFSIDDFGTGYSSLAYLKQMPVDIIKIDRSFVSGMSDNSADMQIVSSISIAMVLSLVHTLLPNDPMLTYNSLPDNHSTCNS